MTPTVTTRVTKPLRGLAKAMKKTFRSSDVIGRHGGDEFVAFCLGSSESQTRTIIDQLGDNIRKENLARAKPYQIIISVGAAEFNPDRPTPLEELIRQADVKMYSSKRGRSVNGRTGATQEKTPS